MTARQLAQYFEDMTVALWEALQPGAQKPDGFEMVGSNIPQLTFSIEGHQYAILKQNPDRNSKAGFLARKGHFIGVVKDMALLENSPSALIGTVNLTLGTGFMAFAGGPVQKITDAVEYVKRHPEVRTNGVLPKREATVPSEHREEAPEEPDMAWLTKGISQESEEAA